MFALPRPSAYGTGKPTFMKTNALIAANAIVPARFGPLKLKTTILNQFSIINIGCLVPFSFNWAVSDKISTSQVYSVLLEIGFTHVFEVERAVEILNESIIEYQNKNTDELPVISSFCPAIVRLIQVKFPSLVDNILKLGTPSDIAARFIRKKLLDQGIPIEDIGIFYITPCAAKIAAIKSPVGEEKSVVNGAINLDTIYNLVLKKIKSGQSDLCATPGPTELFDFEVMWTLTRGEASRVSGKALAVDGIKNAVEFLELVENEE
jgi:hypothetical protein